jgi:mitogen-activated protein kinase kinase
LTLSHSIANSAASASASSSRLGPPKLKTTSGLPQLAIPSTKSFSCLHSDAEEVYEGSAGTSTAAIAASSSTNINHRSIYPETVPYGRNGQVPDTYALTNDLRRAIGGLSIDGTDEGTSAVSGMKPSSSVSSLETPQSSSRTGLLSPSPGTSISSTDRNLTDGQELEEESELQLKGNLEVLERLGEGASGEVRKARYKPTGMIMAMKVSLCRAK